MAKKLKVGSDAETAPVGVNATAIRRLIAGGKPAIIRDDRLPGFHAKLNADGSITFALDYRAGRGRGFPMRRVVIARALPDGKGGIERGAMSIAEARARAEDIKSKARDERAPLDERDPLEARRREAAKLADERAAPTVAELLEAYIGEEVAPTRRPRTVELYRSYLKHILPVIGDVKARDLTRARVRTLHRAIADDEGGGRRVTANRCVVLIRAAFNWGAEEDRLPKGFENPTRGVTFFEEKARERYLDSEEMARLGAALLLAETEGIPYTVDESKPRAKHAPKPENRREVFDVYAVAAIRLLALTGLRLREVLGLRWSDVDFERGVATLPDTKTGRRDAHLGAPALAVIAGLPRTGRFVVASSSAGSPDERPKHDLKRVWAAVTRHAGLEGLRIHDLRHTAASVGAASGVGLVVIGGLLGHKNAKTTARYAHLADTPLKAAANRVAGEIAGAMGLMPAAPGAEIVPIGARRR